MKSKEELIRIFAEAIVNSYYDADRCRYCGCCLNSTTNIEHKDGCVYLLARKVLIEDPFIVHNVMKYGKEYYLKQLATKGCEGCAFDCSEETQLCYGLNIHKDGFIWINFKDIQITDELACSRKDIGDIYLKGALNTLLILKSVTRVYGVLKAIIYIPKNPKSSQLQWTTIDHLRLATIEEIQEEIQG